MAQSSDKSEVLLSLEEVSVKHDLEVSQPTSFRDGFVAFVTRNQRPMTQGLMTLQNVTLTLHRGDRMGLLGRNGAGKSTLCRCAAGLLQPDEGSIQCTGELRAIFESQLAVQPELTGRENAHFLSHFLFPGISKESRDATLKDALAFSGLSTFLDAPFKTYSYGMQTRLGLSLLSSYPSDVLVLDEVFQGADAGFRSRIAARFYALMENSGAVLFVSHSADEVRAVCNRVAVLDGGRVVFDGGVEEGILLYEQFCKDGASDLDVRLQHQEILS